MTSFITGNLARSRATFTDINGVKQDPDVVKMSFKKPSGVIVAYIYGTDVQLVRESQGIYHVDVDTTGLVGR